MPQAGPETGESMTDFDVAPLTERMDSLGHQVTPTRAGQSRGNSERVAQSSI